MDARDIRKKSILPPHPPTLKSNPSILYMKHLLSSSAFADTKPHYHTLNGLRGVAALMVVWYHVFEGFAFAGGTMIDTFNHGYLAVDFFFMLSGFVISYAYDDRWAGKMTWKDFLKRRLIRLHPMIVMGAIIGAIAFMLQGGVKWDGTATPFGWVIVALVMGSLFIPAYPGAGYEVRGNGEMFPLNGPSWSLFFEYLGNLLYVLLLRKLSTQFLALLVAATGAVWAWMAMFNFAGYESMGVGWTLDTVNFWGGTIRLLFPFSFGMLMARKFRPVKVRGMFGIGAVVMFLLFSVPFFASFHGFCVNGVYELLCVAIAFPILVWLGASNQQKEGESIRLCEEIGDLSYPLYIVHYPIMYLFYAWLIQEQRYTLSETWPVVIGVYALCVGLAYACLKLYDIPVRKYLTRRFKVGVK